MVRRRLLEYVFRGGQMEFTAISAHKSKTVSIKSLQGAVSHFEKVAFELHSADAHLNAETRDGAGRR